MQKKFSFKRADIKYKVMCATDFEALEFSDKQSIFLKNLVYV